MSSDLDWTIVWPGAFTYENKTDQYFHGFDGADQLKALKISRADVDDFMLKQVENDAYLHQVPGLSYK